MDAHKHDLFCLWVAQGQHLRPLDISQDCLNQLILVSWIFSVFRYQKEIFGFDYFQSFSRKWKNHTVYWQKLVTWLKFLEYFLKGDLFSVIFQSLIVYTVHFRVTEPVASPSTHWVEGKTTLRTRSLKSLLWQADKLLMFFNFISVPLSEEIHPSCVLWEHLFSFLVWSSEWWIVHTARKPFPYFQWKPDKALIKVYICTVRRSKGKTTLLGVTSACLHMHYLRPQSHSVFLTALLKIASFIWGILMGHNHFL